MIQPYLLGRGSSGRAMAKCLALIASRHPELELASPIQLPRGVRLDELKSEGTPMLFVANPHALHAPALHEAARAGIHHVVAEKPAAISIEQVKALRNYPGKVAICHGYRMLWGPRTLRAQVASGELGQIISVEGRYWQSSAAQRSGQPTRVNWKNDLKLSGPHDVLLDLGAHWADLVCHVLGVKPRSTKRWVSFVNAESPHRDTHLHLQMEFEGGTRSFGSISKTVHGAGNHLEIHVLGEKASLSWSFAEPDRLRRGEGARTVDMARPSDAETTAELAPFHGMGWLEGYLEILTRSVLKCAGMPSGSVPTLEEHLDVVESLLKAEAL